MAQKSAHLPRSKLPISCLPRTAAPPRVPRASASRAVIRVRWGALDKAHRVREPHILPHPLHVLHIPDRTLPELLETELDFVFGLGEMGMEMHTVMARQLGGLLHDVRRDGKGRTWRKNDLYHRTGARVMI